MSNVFVMSNGSNGIYRATGRTDKPDLSDSLSSVHDAAKVMGDVVVND